ncbi:MAG: hypothetical protein WCB11_09050 [Terriglobales bacterium]
MTALPDLNVLHADALRALVVAQHEQLVSAEDKLTTTQEQLLSREREIEHLKLLLVKLHRMQFGRKSEKLARQIEQLELRLEELESNRSEEEATRQSRRRSPLLRLRPQRPWQTRCDNGGCRPMWGRLRRDMRVETVKVKTGPCFAWGGG